MKIYVLGSTGMLGHMLTRTLKLYETREVIPVGRHRLDASLSINKIYKQLGKLNIQENDYVINCIGLTKQRSNNYKKLNKINRDFPQLLSDLNAKLIHISTDCVFNGVEDSGNYTESCIPFPNDLYGHSKRDGENTKGLIIRTSFIGPELKQPKVGLLEWLRNGEIVKDGYLNHYWNGLTTLELSETIAKIIRNNLWEEGIHHIYSPHILSKYCLLQEINRIFKLKKIILPVIKSTIVNRSLSSEKNLVYTLDIKTIPDQLIWLNLYCKQNKKLYD